MKRLALLSAAALGALALVVVMWHFRAVLILFVLSLAVTATLRPLADRQAQRGWPRSLALLAVYGLTIGLAGLLLWVVAGPIADDAQDVADDLSIAYERAWLMWPTGSDWQQALAAWMPTYADLYESVTGPAGDRALQGVLGLTLNLFDVLASAGLVLVMSLYWGLDQARAERLWLSVLPVEHRARAREVWRAIERGVGSYLRSELVQSLLAGMLLGLGYWALGINHPALLGAMTAVFWLVPWLGVVLALAPVLAVSLAQSPYLAMWAGLYTLLVFVILEFGVEPRLYNRRKHSALLVVLLLIVLGRAFGVPGILAAPPLAVALQILVTHALAPTPAAPQKPVKTEYAVLVARLTELRTGVAAGGEAPSAHAANLTARLADLLDDTADALADGGWLDSAETMAEDAAGTVGRQTPMR